MQNILVLCIGNICRSPIAEALLRQHFPGKTIWSAGLGALVGKPADPQSVAVSERHGVGLSDHRAQQVSAFMCQQAELILVMEQSHKSELMNMYPWTRGKVFRLGEWGQFDIADPYRQPPEAFEKAYEGIAQGVADWVPRINKLSSV